MENPTSPDWPEIMVDLLTHALDVLTLDELREIFEDLELCFPELPRGSLFELMKEFQSLEVRSRIAPDFSEQKFVQEWAKREKIPYSISCVAGGVKR
jgi:hypothetical protein